MLLISEDFKLFVIIIIDMYYYFIGTSFYWDLLPDTPSVHVNVTFSLSLFSLVFVWLNARVYIPMHFDKSRRIGRTIDHNFEVAPLKYYEEVNSYVKLKIKDNNCSSVCL